MSGAVQPNVTIIGAGVAGLAAGVALAGHGVPVRVIETRRHLGGRAGSFVDRETGELLDNCQHVLMRGCVYLLDFYRRLGVTEQIEWHEAFDFIDGEGRRDRLEADDLPAPLHMARSLFAFKSLTLRDKLSIARGMRAILRADLAAAKDQSFADWLARSKPTTTARQRFWDPVVISACNEQPQLVPAHYALKVFREGFLVSREAYHMGLSRVALRDLYGPAEELIRQGGGQVTLGCAAAGFGDRDGRISELRLTSGDTLSGGAFISAVPPDRLAKLASPTMRQAEPLFAAIEQIRFSPIVGIHLFAARTDGEPVMREPHLALNDSPVHWLFNKGPAERRDEAGTHKGQHLHAVISAAHDLAASHSDDLVAMAWHEAQRVLPMASGASLIAGRAIKEKRATFVLEPGIDARRPGPRCRVPNLLLAGDWCDTGWPATMEGAVRSGYAAARALLDERGIHGSDLIVPELEPAPLYRWLCRG